MKSNNLHTRVHPAKYLTRTFMHFANHILLQMVNNFFNTNGIKLIQI